MKTIIISIGLICTLLLTSCSSTKQVTSFGKELSWMDGEWVGQGYQLDAISNPTWEINLDVNSDKKICNINYPSLECSGKWELFKGDKNSAIFKEIIIKGKDKCYNGGQLVITKVNENHLSYSFFYPDNGRLGAYSTLIKKEFYKEFNSTHL